MRISPVTRPVDEIFRGSFLRIPRFQRPYSWDQENVADFWNDLANRADADYFMGSTVLFPDSKERDVLSIVDGQQRLTTITIALAIVRAEFDEMGEPDLADGVQAVLERRDIDNKMRFVLEHEPRNKFFQDAIQKRRGDAAAQATSEEEKSLKAALDALRTSLDEDLLKYAAKREKIARLKTLRNRLLSLLFISIQLDDEDDAYTIFETLNTRGKDLRVVDLAKNLFTRLMKQKNKSFDEAKESWQRILARLESVSPSVDADTFLLHYWLSQHAYVSKANLYKEMKKVISDANAKAMLADLVDAANVYVQTVVPASHTWANEERALRRSLAALQVFRVAQAAPLTFAIMRKYRAKVISLASAGRAIAYVEKFSFIFNAITQSRGGGGIANMYARLAQRVRACSTAQEFATVSEEIKDRLTYRVNPLDEFTLGFVEVAFRSDYTRERALVRYILGKFADHFGLPPATDHALLTIEHIRGESQYSSEEEYWQVARIGNLLFVSEKTNEKLKTKPFPEKKKVLASDGVPLDPYLAVATDWSLDDIDKRARALAEEGYKKIWWI
jgi:hypothetical protein